MTSYTFDKRVKLNVPSDSLSSLIIDDKLDYVKLDSGLHIQGVITLSGECRSEGAGCSSFGEKIDVDIMIPYDEITDYNTTRLKIDGYTYDFDNDSLIIHVNCSLFGESPNEEKLDINKVKKNKKNVSSRPLFQSENMALRSSVSEEAMKEIEQLVSSGAEVISTFDESTREATTHSVEVPVTKEEKKENKKTDKEGKNLEPIVVDVGPYGTPGKKIKKEPIVNEGYAIFSSFYRVNKGDTYENIAEKYKVPVARIVSANNGVELKEGIFIRIPLQ